MQEPHHRHCAAEAQKPCQPGCERRSSSSCCHQLSTAADILSGHLSQLTASDCFTFRLTAQRLSALHLAAVHFAALSFKDKPALLHSLPLHPPLVQCFTASRCKQAIHAVDCFLLYGIHSFAEHTCAESRSKQAQVLQHVCIVFDAAIC